MPLPRDIAVVDTLIGFRGKTNIRPIAALKGSDSDGSHDHPAGYLFSKAPPAFDQSLDPTESIAETVSLMDRHHIGSGLVSLSDPMLPIAMKKHPGRFLASLPVDGNEGMQAVEKIKQAVAEYDLRAVTTFPCGVMPQIPIDHKRWYPVYTKCAELKLPVFIATGVPGPRVPMKAQHVELLDEVCYDFPELNIVMRHGGEPWTDLAVKLMLKWPNLYYSTSGFAPKHYPRAIIDYANTRGADKIIYAGYFPFGIELDRTFSELENLPLKAEVWPKFLRHNAARLLGLNTETP